MLTLDSSVAVPLVLVPHTAHGLVRNWWRARDVALCGLALVETYSVLTRLPGDIRVRPEDAARLIRARFPHAIQLSPETAASATDVLGRMGIAGGAAYDALVALAAVEHDAVLATRDLRAKATYDLIGARTEYVQ